MLDRKNFITIFNTHNKEIYNFILSRIGYNIQLAEDITQEIFTKAWNNRERYVSKKGSVRTWLFIIARNTLTDEYRKDSKRKTAQSIENYTETVAAESGVYDKAMYFDVVSNLNKLKDKDKELIELKYTFGFSMKEIGKIINKLENATKVKIHRVVKKLRKLMNEK